ncbi:MAG: serine hydrolase domain-containing protein [Egibacteraceae bacterium]
MRPRLDAAGERQLLARTARAQRDGRLPSVTVAVTDERELLWSTGRGRVDGERPTVDTQYRIGSITKTFTAVIVMQLRDEGELALHDRVESHLPEVGAGIADRTVAELLAHAGGVRAETSPPWWERTPGREWEALTADLGAQGAQQGARGRFHYSNVGYAVLGELVARRRGAAWHEVLHERVLRPLGLHRTTVQPVPPVASGSAVHPWLDVLLPEPAHDTRAMGPAGQLWSTVEDLAGWARFLLNGSDDLLSVETLEEMLQPRVVGDDAPVSAYGLGFDIATVNERTLVGHGGSMPGFVAGLRIDREERIAAVALANATTGMEASLLDDLLEVVRLRSPRIVDEWIPDAEHAPEVGDLVGVWYWGPRPFALRGASGGRPELAALEPGGRGTRLERVAPDEWVGLGGYFDGEPLRVLRRDDGEISHLELASFVFTREPHEPGDVIPGAEPWPT